MRMFILISLMFPSIVFASIVEVFPGGSIQSAVDSASINDTVLVHDGDYAETVIPYGKSLTIASAYILDGDTNHITATAITPGTVHPDTGSCFVYAYSEPAPNRLIGLTMSQGAGTYWNFAQDFAGGAIYVYRTRLEVRRCRILYSNSTHGGGIGIIGTTDGAITDLTIRECLIANCQASFAGGIYAFRCSVYVQSVVFDGDIAESDIGGLGTIDGYKEVHSCVFRNCIGATGGAVIEGRGGFLTNCVFEDNIGWFANHLTVTGRRHVVYNNLFGPSSSASSAVNLCCYPSDTVVFVHNRIENATSTEGVVMPVAGVSGEIAYNSFLGNLSGGGAVEGLQHSNARIHHNWFSGNRAINVGSVYLAGPTAAGVTLDSNVITGNVGQTMNYMPFYTSVIDARNNWWGHPSGPYHPTLNPSGQGDTLLSDSVLFIPWLTEPPDTTIPPDYLAAPKPRPTISRAWELADAYPNPFNQSVTLILAGFTGGDFEIGLYNLLGQQVGVIHRGALTGGQLHYQAPPWLASGVYLLSARDKRDVQTKKVVLLK